jgi:hypothetical protein
VRRVRRADFLTIENSFSPSRVRPGFMPGVSTYSAVQICEATSGLIEDTQRRFHECPSKLVSQLAGTDLSLPEDSEHAAPPDDR